MKISILTSVFYQKCKEVDGEDRIIFGGAERYLIELCKFLQADGHEVKVYQACRGEQMLYKEYAGISIQCLPVQDKWELHVAPRLNQAFYELSLGADLRIYFASFLCWPTVKAPAISINHGIFWDYPEYLVRHVSPTQKEMFYERQIYGMTAVDACVAVDTNVRGVLAALRPGEERKITVIPNFVDTDQFKPAEERPWDKLRILYPRRITPLRGINEFLLAAQALPEFEFITCGQAFNQDAEAMLEKAGAAMNIRQTHRPMEEMAEIYKEADIAIIPTRAAEGTSLSCLEAMAAGLPVITTPAGGLPNLIIDRWNGRVVDINNENLTDTIKELANDTASRLVYGHRNREMVEECFSLEVWKDRWRKLLNRIL